MAITLRRLKITRFRNVRPGTELHFSDGWNVLLGRNATGKTTLLHLISMALRGDFDAIKDDPFELEWIEDCVRAMEGRQKFVTAQNPLLLDHVGFESHEDVTRSFVLCRAEPLPENHRGVIWTHPSEAQAREFFRAYENGVLRVHEILRTEGLW